jgi:uncharacterized membrane protein YadS
MGASERAVDALRRYGPGLAVMVAVAAVARLLATATGLSALLFAVGGAALVANTVGVPAWARPGLDSHKLLLETGIVLLGAGLTLDQLTRAGPRVVALAVLGVVAGVASVELLCRRAGVRDRAGALVASGAGVCGVSAVVAVAGGVDADETDVAYAVGTVLLYDAVTLVAFPAAGALLALDPRIYGVWAGVSMFSTGPVAAAGFAHSQTAGQWATVTKLVRNALIGAVVVYYSLRFARREATGRAEATTRTDSTATDEAPSAAGVTAPTGGDAEDGGEEPHDRDRGVEPDDETRPEAGPADDGVGGEGAAGGRGVSVADVWTRFPKFVVGFLAAALLANTVLPGAAAPAGRAADALFALAFVGLGFEIDLAAVREARPAPVVAVGVHLLVWSVLALAIVSAVL